MKKIYLMSLVVIMSAVVLLAFSFKNSDESKLNPKGSILVSAYGCSDCKNIQYCLDGGPIIYPRSCEWYVNCKDPTSTYEICVICSGENGETLYGHAQISCSSPLGYVIIMNQDPQCSCSESKKIKK
jgi:hypothetical protein